MAANAWHTGRWIVSRRFDLAILAIPLAASLASLLTLHEEIAGVPLWAYLVLIVAFDVAHVWATVYVTYLDGDALRRRRWLFWLPVPLAFLISYRLHAHSDTLFWTLLAYVAIYHFIKQQYGFIALYKARAGEKNRFDYHLDKITLWAGALGPVLLWHASPARQFDWFNAGESFIATIDPALKPDILAVVIAIGVLYVARQVQIALVDRSFNLGKNLWMACAWLSWVVGIGLSTQPLVSAAFLNLFHGIPFLAIVWYRCNRTWSVRVPSDRSSRLVAWLSQRKRWLLFYAAILLPALVEEALWDGAVWRAYLPALSPVHIPEPSPSAVTFWVALLSVPQIVHYFLDAWIWKLDGSNPDLEQAFSATGDDGS